MLEWNRNNKNELKCDTDCECHSLFTIIKIKIIKTENVIDEFVAQTKKLEEWTRKYFCSVCKKGLREDEIIGDVCSDCVEAAKQMGNLCNDCGKPDPYNYCFNCLEAKCKIGKQTKN